MQLDLNLLTALDALLDEGSVNGAAARLHVTAPAMSRTLGRIRKATGDEILVRVGRSMVPTAHALAIREHVRDLVHQAHQVLAPQQDVELSTLDRVFSIRWHDTLAEACGPKLVAGVRRQAPRARLRLLAESSSDSPDLHRGEVDLESSSSRPVEPHMRCHLVGEDRLVIALRPGHPLAGGPLTADLYAAAEHVTVSRRGRLSDPIDDVLAVHGLQRTVAVAAPTAASALRLVLEEDLVVTVPAAVTRAARTDLGLLGLPLPLDVPPTQLYLLWHQRFDNDRAHAWFRGQAISTVKAAFSVN
ncbi:LysR family transcriptional regulator [Streptomyces hokutonensis]|uniref:LysR family transcriptional regulator n=1 Tax=Streptomyces hokutonensis TaxID=1306990 RepID=UPI00380F8C6A